MEFTIEYDYGLAAQNHNANQLSKETHKDGQGAVTETLTYSYDNFGNRTGTSGGLTETVSYDYENRILSVTHAGTTSTYQHDYRSRRVVRNEGPSTRTVTYGGGTSLQEYDGAARKVQYVRGSDLGGGVGGILYSDPEGDDARYFHYNTRGDVTVKTPASGAVSDLDYVASYGAFGDVLFETHANEDPQGPNTKEVGAHGIIHEGFRDRRGHTFYQRDPLGFVDTSNLYAYAANNPRTHFDAHGLTIDELGDERLLSGWEAIDKIREGGFYLPRWYDDLVTQHKDPWLHAAYSLGGRSAVKTYIENFDKAMQLGEILGTFGLTMTPGAGEAMDINTLTDPNASGFAKSMAAGSLALNAITLTLAPNIGKPLQGLEEGIPSVPPRNASRPRQTGAGMDDVFADEAYDAIRASTKDVAEIASKTGLKPENIQKVKDHVFLDKHLLDRYVDYGVPAKWARFDSSPRIADAWNRLRKGSHTRDDIQLLRHEIAEAWFMRKHGPGYNAAHEAAENAARGSFKSPLN